MMRTALALGLTTLSLVATAPVGADPQDWATASDIGRDVLVVTALGLPAAKGDWRGDVQAGASLLAAGGSTWALKELVRERRPDASDRRSFPSGHTSVSFAAAVSLERRYGWQIGLPALGVATVVGAGRVAADKHYVHDVLVGAAIGGAAGWLLTSPRDDRARLLPWAARGGGGLTLATRW